jgi:hypothetical protein
MIKLKQQFSFLACKFDLRPFLNSLHLLKFDNGEPNKREINVSAALLTSPSSNSCYMEIHHDD